MEQTIKVIMECVDPITGKGVRDTHEEFGVDFKDVISLEEGLLDLMYIRLKNTKKKHGIK